MPQLPHLINSRRVVKYPCLVVSWVTCTVREAILDGDLGLIIFVLEHEVVASKVGNGCRPFDVAVVVFIFNQESSDGSGE